MSYYSVLRMPEQVILTKTVSEDEDFEKKKEIIDNARELGLTVVDENAEETLNEIQKCFESLGPRDETAAWWLYPKYENGQFTLEAYGESGKAYDFGVQLRNLVRALEIAGYITNGTIYLEGEAVGDLTRYTIRNSHVVKAEAKLVFDDGEIYS